MKNNRFSQYRSMWIMVFFDLPTETKVQRKAAAKFRKDIIGDGFTMFQFSIYIRHCASKESLDVHLKRVKRFIPQEGSVGVLCITDKQFAAIELYYGASATPTPMGSPQLELF